MGNNSPNSPHRRLSNAPKAASTALLVGVLVITGTVSGCDDDSNAVRLPATTTAVPRFDGSPEQAFCVPAKKAFAIRTTSTVEETRKAFDALADNQDQLIDSAPDEIKDDVELMMSKLEEIRKAYESVDYDIGRLSAKDVEGARDPNYTAATDRVFGYYDQVCAGIAPTTVAPAADGETAPPAPAPTDPAETTTTAAPAGDGSDG